MLRSKLPGGFVNRRKTQILGFKLLQVLQMEGGGDEAADALNKGAVMKGNRAHSMAASKYI